MPVRPARATLEGLRIVGLVARGAMSCVYRAQELDTGRPVALKVPRRTAAGSAAALERERAALSRLAHPRVVGLRGSGVLPDGRGFLVLEWLEGEDLAHRLARGALDLDDALRIATDLCDGLGAAHAAGLVHGDVKPGNVVIGPDGHATLLDFGLAETAGAGRRARSGSAAYLAPDLIGGRRPLDARADVYALGCTLFECLAGAPPFGVEAAAQIFLRATLEATPRLRSSKVDVPAWLDALVAALLQKRAEERPADAIAVGEMLSRGGAGPWLARPVGDATQELRSHSFALLRLGDGRGDATLDIDAETAAAPPAVVEICEGFGVALDAPPLDALVLTAPDADPRDQLRRLVGASLGITLRVAGARVALVSGAVRATRDAIARGRALLEHVPRGSVYADRDTGRLAPTGSADFEPRVLRSGEGALVVVAATSSDRHTLVGRDELTRRLCASLANDAFVVLLAGAGVGKTAVLASVRATQSREPAPILDGQLHLAGAPYRAMRAWLGAWLCRVGRVDEPTLRAELARLQGARGAAHVPELARLLGVEGAGPWADGSRDALESAIVGFVRAALAGGPLFVDDAQWLDAPSAATLARLLSEPGRPSVLIAARPELRAGFPELLARASSVEELPLLGAEASVELVVRSEPTLPSASVSAVVRDAEGHPLLLRELAHAAARDDASALPATAVGLVQARLMRLSANARRGLAVACALGGDFEADVVARHLPAGEWHEALAELRAARVLVGDPADPTRLRFATPLGEEAAYALLTDAERAAIHGAIARDIAARGSVEPAELLRHAARAGDQPRVVLAHVLAAERAVALFAYETALAAVADGVSAGASGVELGRLRLCDAESLLEVERYAEARVRALEAQDLLRAGSAYWVSALHIRVRAALRRLQPDEMTAVFDLLAPHPVDEGTATDEKLRTLLRVAADLILLGLVDEGDAKTAAVEAIVRAHPEVVGLEADLSRLRARNAQAHGRWSRVLAEFEHAERIHVAEGDTPGAVVARFNRANALFELSDYASAVAVARAAVSEAEDLELNYALGYGRFMLGVFLRRSGERVSWRDELERALASSDDDPRLAGEIAVELALDALERGDPAEARRRIEGAVAALEPAPTQLAQAYAVRSMVALRSGETRAAAQWAERAREIAAPLGLMVDDLTLVRLSLLQVCVATGDARGPGLAREAIAELEERGRRLGDATLVPSFLARPYNRWLVDAARALGAGSGGRSRDAS